jgi:hypothetical protein
VRAEPEDGPAFAAARNGFEGEGVCVEDIAALLGREVQEVAELLAIANRAKPGNDQGGRANAIPAIATR